MGRFEQDKGIQYPVLIVTLAQIHESYMSKI